jgi:hypothetical protein
MNAQKGSIPAILHPQCCHWVSYTCLQNECSVRLITISKAPTSCWEDVVYQRWACGSHHLTLLLSTLSSATLLDQLCPTQAGGCMFMLIPFWIDSTPSPGSNPHNECSYPLTLVWDIIGRSTLIVITHWPKHKEPWSYLKLCLLLLHVVSISIT